MPKQSSGILLYRRKRGQIEVFLVHPGGPFWSKRDSGAWSIPKGEYAEGEDPLAAAKREFREETSFAILGKFEPLLPVKQKGGKVVHAWAVEGDCDASAIKSNTFSMEWPPHSGKQQNFPEVDRAAWFTVALAKENIVPAQVGLIEQLENILASL